MSKIPKEIVKKLEEIKTLKEEVRFWCVENLDMDMMNFDSIEIVNEHFGDEQGDDDCKEWCNQSHGYLEDDCYGDYYWETEVRGKYLHMSFSSYGGC